MLKHFLLRFNHRFGVPAHDPDVAHRPVETQVCLDVVLCFKHRRRVARDNTVKYRWRTLQLLPSRDQPSYAVVTVEVIESLDSQLSVQYRGVGERLSPLRKLRLVRASSATSTDVPHTRTCHTSMATALADAGLRCWRPSIRSEWPGRLAMASLPMGPRGCKEMQPAHEGSPHPSRQPGGQRYRRQSAGGCPFEGSRESWGSTGARPKSTWRLRARPWRAIEFQWGPPDLLTWQVELVTFMLAPLELVS